MRDHSRLKLWIVSVVMLLLSFCLWYFSGTILLFLISAFFGFLLSPFVDMFQRLFRTKSRLLPTALVYILGLSLIGVFLVIFIPLLYDQIVSVVRNISGYVKDISALFDKLEAAAVGWGLPDFLISAFSTLTAKLEATIPSVVVSLGTAVVQKSAQILDIVLFMCLTFYFMMDGKHIVRSLTNSLPEYARLRLNRIMQELNLLVWSYLKQQIAISMIMSLVSLIGFWCFGLEYALLLAFVAFILNFIPYFGSILAGFISVVSAFLSGGFSTALGVAIFVLCVQQVEGNVVTPLLQARTADVHPLAIIFSLLACNKLFGVFGLFISVPFAGLVKILIYEIRDLYGSIDRPGGFGSPDPNRPLHEPLVTSRLILRSSRFWERIRSVLQNFWKAVINFFRRLFSSKKNGQK